MSKRLRRNAANYLTAVAAVSFGLGAFATLEAANSGTTNLFRPQGEDAATNQGDYVSTALSGSNDHYAYFIEVPPQTGNITVDIFDADVGNTSGGQEHDRDVSGSSFTADARYRLYRPSGAQVLNVTYDATGSNENAANDSWRTMYVENNPQPGHWELQVEIDNGDEWNAFGLRVYDGAGNQDTDGVELNVYHQPFVNVGVNPDGDGNYLLYPYVTSDCEAQVHEFDWDDPSGGTSGANGNIQLTSRDGEYTRNFTDLTDNNTWSPPAQHFLTGSPSWPGAAAANSGLPGTQAAAGYGIWTAAINIDDDTGNTAGQGNYAQVYMTYGTGQPVTPSSQNVTGSIRIYLPTDGVNGNTPGGAPVKPYAEQFYTHVSGPNPPLTLQTTRVNVQVVLTNPTSRPIIFSPSNLVTATVPGLIGAGVGTAGYGGNAAVTQGSIVSQPGIGLGGTVTWNPGVVLANSTATLNYHVLATPATSGASVRVTGTVSSGGTTARFVDETGNTTQARATYTCGPLCTLALPAPANNSTLSVEFASMKAECEAPGSPVVISWETLEEVSNVGFNVYLGKEDDRAMIAYERLNDSIIPAQGGNGAFYAFVDDRPTTSYSDTRTYFIEDIDASGIGTIHGPFTMSFSTAGMPTWENY